MMMITPLLASRTLRPPSTLLVASRTLRPPSTPLVDSRTLRPPSTLLVASRTLRLRRPGSRLHSTATCLLPRWVGGKSSSRCHPPVTTAAGGKSFIRLTTPLGMGRRGRRKMSAFHVLLQPHASFATYARRVNAVMTRARPVLWTVVGYSPPGRQRR